jgi:hypothetical protein
MAIGAIAIGFALNAVVPVPSAAQDWPTRPITLVVAAAAGGGSDVVGRVLSPHLSEILRQQVIIENIGGAGRSMSMATSPPISTGCREMRAAQFWIFCASSAHGRNSRCGSAGNPIPSPSGTTAAFSTKPSGTITRRYGLAAA